MKVAARRALRNALQHWRMGDGMTALRQFLEVGRCALSATTIGMVNRLSPLEGTPEPSLRDEHSGIPA
jgi:hypothetical protein